jgi:hypothetical integral membrane protein (TIGR02206 family)
MVPFERWGTDHIVALALTVAVPLALAAWTRRAGAGGVRRACESFFVAILVGETLVRIVWLHAHDALPAWVHLAPMHMCDWALWACVLTCIWRRRLAFECAYFWGLAGTLQGLITPDLAYDFPSMQFALFFLGHSGIVGCVLYLVASGAFRPTWSSVRRAYVGLLVYGVAAGLYDAVTHTNFGYLRAKPSVPSLLDHLGPWPWYIGSLLAVAAVNFVLLYLPWAIADRWRINEPRR